MRTIRASIIAAVAATILAAANLAAEEQQQGSIPPDVTDKLANDLANLQSEIEAAQQQQADIIPLRKEVVVTRDGTWVFEGADQTAPKEFTAPKGKVFMVVDKAGDWYAVHDTTGKTG